MRILGIDPGTRVAGYGLVDVSDASGGAIRGVAAGAWKLDGKAHLAARLANLAVEFRRVLDAYNPTHLCIELAFVANNVRSALFLGHARGVILSEAYQRGLVISEMSATAAKKIITSYGRAEKEDLARVLSQILSVNLESLPLDASDALGIAYAQAVVEKDNRKLGALAGQNTSAGENQILSQWQASRKKKSKSGFELLVRSHTR